VEGKPLRGLWFDRTQEYAARRKGEDFDRLRFATVETLHLSPLPCWEHLSEEVWRHRALGIVQEIEEEAAARRSRTGSRPLGVSAVRDQHPTTVPRAPSAPLLRWSMPPAPGSGGRSGPATPGSSRPSEPQRKSSGRETAPRPSPPGAFRQRCRS